MNDTRNDLGKRNATIDIVRALCLLLIVLAHVDAPNWIQEIRCFDVVCLVFLSGMSYQISASRKKEHYLKYMGKRIKKLLIPTYVILTLIFLTVFIINHSPEPIGLIKMIESYLLYNGIGYVWFVRVILMLAAISPALLITQQTSSRIKQIILFFSWIIVYVGLVTFYNASILPFWPNLFIYLIPIFLLGYGIPYAFGMQYHKLHARTKGIVAGLLVVCCIVAYYCGFKSTSADKYPPGLLYLSWGEVWAIILYEFFNVFNLTRIPNVISFLSENSFEIYLFHIIPLLLIKYNSNSALNTINSNWVIQYVFVLGVALVMTLIYQAVRNVLKERRREKIS